MGDESGVGARKRGRSGDDVRRVAEIVMVLEAMGRMREGREPTGIEKELAAEARERLVEVCAALRPSDLFASDAARVVAGDLGFNKDPIGGSRAAGRRMSIAEKLASTKKKMEDAKQITTQTPQNPFPPQQGVFATKTENRAAVFHGSNRLFPDKPSQTPISASTVFVPVMPLAHASTLASSSMKQPQFSETPLRPSAGSMERDSSMSAVARNEAGHFRMDAHPSGTPYVSNVQATSPATRILKKTTVSPVRSTSAAVSKPTHVTKLIDNVFPKAENAHAVTSFQTSSQVKIEQGSKSSTVNTLEGNMSVAQQPQHVVNLVPAPSSTISHFDIARTIQKILHPNTADLPCWSPPSVDYMIQPLNCQICKISITDLESLLVCDACEKGVHLRCLKSFTQRAASNIEWHCPKCLLSSNGKPLPPKYGKVTRNIGASKVSSNTGGAHTSSEKRSETVDAKVTNQQVAANPNPSSANTLHAYPATVSHSQSEPDKKMLVAGETPCKNASMSGLQKVDNACKGTDASHIKENGRSLCMDLGAPPESSNQCMVNGGLVSCNMQGQTFESSSEPKVKPTQHLVELPTADVKVSHQLQSITTAENVAEMPFRETVSKDLHQETNKCADKEIKKPLKSTEMSSAMVHNEVRQETMDDSHAISTVDGEYGTKGYKDIKWVGATLDTAEEKIYYQSCCINGLVYSLQDVVLISSDGLGVSPAKLQVLWENNNDGSKWAIVNRFYLPNDLPDFIIRPSTPENDEVYESNDSITVKAGCIHGPCVALPLMKFKEESERRTSLRDGESSVHPTFLCRWFYDKSKTLFQPIIE